MNNPGFYIINIISLFFIGMNSPAISQATEINNVRMAIKSGSSKELAKYFGDNIELHFDGEKSNFTKTAAEIRIRDFFRKNPPVDFQYIHQGSSGEGLKYAIGKYSISNGSYRIYMLFKKTNDSYYVDTIDFTRE